jgi:hypothetical protein
MIALASGAVWQALFAKWGLHFELPLRPFRAAEKVHADHCGWLVAHNRVEPVDLSVSFRLPTTADAIRRTVEKAGIEYIDENGGGPSVRLWMVTRKLE